MIRRRVSRWLYLKAFLNRPGGMPISGINVIRPAQTLCLVIIFQLNPGFAAGGDTAVYAVHVGFNQSPDKTSLSDLQYADDDAVGFYAFTRTFARDSRLVTIMDTDSQKLHPDLANECIPPDPENLRQLLAKLAQDMRNAKKKGKNVVLYFSYSGHGLAASSGARLTMLNGYLDGRWFEKHIMNLPADAIHLFIDACHAQGLVDWRGAIRREQATRIRRLSSKEYRGLFADFILRRHPHVGALVATSADQATLEWTHLRAGVFTHELLSALRGAADVNHDGRIEYSEAAAFISAANHSVLDRKMVPNVVSFPPLLNHNTPILDFDWMRVSARLKIRAWPWARFSIQTEKGIRLLDAHPELGSRMEILLPAKERMWIKSGEREALMEPLDDVIWFEELGFQSADTTKSRGRVASILHKHLFATRFGPSYYRGWIDKQGEIGVAFDESSDVMSVYARDSRAPSVACWVGAAISGAVAATFLVLAVDAKQDYDNTSMQAEAQEARTRLVRNQLIAGGAVLATIGLAWAGWMLKPKDSLVIRAVPLSHGFCISAKLSW